MTKKVKGQNIQNPPVQDNPVEMAIDQEFLKEFRKLSARYKRDFTLGTRYIPEGALTTIILKRLF